MANIPLTELIEPPHMRTDENTNRRVGVELEFGDISPQRTADVVQNLFGGQIKKEDPYKLLVEHTQYGTFVIELDTQYAHPKSQQGNTKQGFIADMANRMAETVGDISKSFVPMEIACPPLDIEALPKLEKLVEALRQAKATGTNKEIYYAFGCQLNPELARLDIEFVLKNFKAWLLLEDWLRMVAANDLSRHLTAFANPFSRKYAKKVLKETYAPTWEGFISDYLKDNNTRNRGLDMLPLMVHVRPETQNKANDARIKARPTFHYRIPDSRIDEPAWTLVLEWNRWVQVELLAENPEMFHMLKKKYLEKSWSRRSWAREVANVLQQTPLFAENKDNKQA